MVPAEHLSRITALPVATHLLQQAVNGEHSIALHALGNADASTAATYTQQLRRAIALFWQDDHTRPPYHCELHDTYDPLAPPLQLGRIGTYPIDEIRASLHLRMHIFERPMHGDPDRRGWPQVALHESVIDFGDREVRHQAQQLFVCHPNMATSDTRN